MTQHAVPASGAPISVVAGTPAHPVVAGEVLGNRVWHTRDGRPSFAWRKLGTSISPQVHLLTLDSEGYVWCRGWEGPEVDALLATQALLST